MSFLGEIRRRKVFKVADVHPQRDELIISPSFGFFGDITILLNWQAQLPAAAR